MAGRSHECDEETVKVNEEKADLESQHHNVSSKIDKTTAEQFKSNRLSSRSAANSSWRWTPCETTRETLVRWHHHVPKDLRANDRVDYVGTIYDESQGGGSTGVKVWCIFVCHPHLTIILCLTAVWAQACGSEHKTSFVIIVHLWFSWRLHLFVVVVGGSSNTILLFLALIS